MERLHQRVCEDAEARGLGLLSYHVMSKANETFQRGNGSLHKGYITITKILVLFQRLEPINCRSGKLMVQVTPTTTGIQRSTAQYCIAR
jgi:hypothetical protein